MLLGVDHALWSSELGIIRLELKLKFESSIGESLRFRWMGSPVNLNFQGPITIVRFINVSVKDLCEDQIAPCIRGALTPNSRIKS